MARYSYEFIFIKKCIIVIFVEILSMLTNIRWRSLIFSDKKENITNPREWNRSSCVCPIADCKTQRITFTQSIFFLSNNAMSVPMYSTLIKDFKWFYSYWKLLCRRETLSHLVNLHAGSISLCKIFSLRLTYMRYYELDEATKAIVHLRSEKNIYLMLI